MDEFTLRGKSVPEHLRLLAGNGNPEFVAALNPGVTHILGCRLPDLRKLAKDIAKSEERMLYLETAGTFFMEERMLYGLVLGYIPLQIPFKTYLVNYVDTFVSRINCWAVCDSFKFAGSQEYLDTNKEELWDYLLEKSQSADEYTVRFGVVMSMRYFMDITCLDDLFHLYESIRHPGYYVKMAVAWALSECFVNYPGRTKMFLRDSRLDIFTFNKTLQKITESRRVAPGIKTEIRKLKQKR